jgi:hypothetical protein
LKIAAFILSVVLGVCLLPIIIPLITLAFSSLTGCIPDGNSACIVFGTDLREWLNFGVMFHWFALVTLPFAALAGLGLLLLLAVHLVRRLWRRRQMIRSSKAASPGSVP